MKINETNSFFQESTKSTQEESSAKPHFLASSEAIREAVEHLNRNAGTKFRPNSKATITLIEALFHKGYTLSDIRRVIDSRIKEWGNNPRMKRYLKPNTLFDVYNFRKYLREVSDNDLLTKTDQL